MIKTIVLSVMLLPLLTIQAQNKSFSSAIEFNDYLINEQLGLFRTLDVYNATLETGTETEIWAALDKLIVEAETVQNNLLNVTPYEAGTELLNSFKSLIGFYINTFKTDYKRMTQIVLKTELSAEDEAELGEILERVTTTEAQYDATFMTVQEAFAKFHGFELVDPEGE